MYSITKVIILLWSLLWWLALKPKLTLKADHSESLKQGVLLGVVMILPIFGLFFGFKDYFMQFSPNIEAKIISFNLVNYYILFAIFLSIIHSFLEEYYWRWFVFRGLMLKFKALPAALISSAAFASHHFIILSAFFPTSLTILFGTSVGLGGLLWCWLYNKTGSLAGTWISHLFVDAAIMTVGYIMIM